MSDCCHLSQQGICPWRGPGDRAVAGRDDGSSWQLRALRQAHSQVPTGGGDGRGVAGGMDGLHRTHLSSFLPGLPCDPGTSLGVLRPPPRREEGLGTRG